MAQMWGAVGPVALRPALSGGLPLSWHEYPIFTSSIDLYRQFCQVAGRNFSVRQILENALLFHLANGTGKRLNRVACVLFCVRCRDHTACVHQIDAFVQHPPAQRPDYF